MNDTSPFNYGPLDIEKIKNDINSLNENVSDITNTIGDTSEFPEDYPTVAEMVTNNYNSISDIQDFLSIFNPETIFTISGSTQYNKIIECGNMKIISINDSINATAGNGADDPYNITIEALKNYENFIISFEPYGIPANSKIWCSKRYVGTNGSVRIEVAGKSLSENTTIQFYIIVLQIPTTL